ncbi:apoptosis-associated speck-like protein containing a CARD [Guaruba guarouba]
MASSSSDAFGGPPLARGRDRILRVLEELTALELRRVKAALNQAPVAAGYRTVPRGRMEGADALDLTDLIIGHYGELYGVTVMGEALRSIQRRDLAEWLLRDAPHRPPDDAPDDAASDASPLPAERFVLRHRAALVQGVRAVAPLLDRLQAGGALSAEDAAAVAAGATPQERMRRLLDTAPAWGRSGHGCFLRALRELQPLLMEELGPP